MPVVRTKKAEKVNRRIIQQNIYILTCETNETLAEMTCSPRHICHATDETRHKPTARLDLGSTMTEDIKHVSREDRQRKERTDSLESLFDFRVDMTVAANEI